MELETWQTQVRELETKNTIQRLIKESRETTERVKGRRAGVRLFRFAILCYGSKDVKSPW